MGSEKVISISWEEINNCVDSLAEQIKNSQIKFSRIFAIPRGGLVIGVMISHKLGIPMITEQDRKPETLIVDEIWDTGKTATDSCMENQKFACIHFKPKADKTGRKPDFYCAETNAWINYPWEYAQK